MSNGPPVLKIGIVLIGLVAALVFAFVAGRLSRYSFRPAETGASSASATAQAADASSAEPAAAGAGAQSR